MFKSTISKVGTNSRGHTILVENINLLEINFFKDKNKFKQLYLKGKIKELNKFDLTF